MIIDVTPSEAIVKIEFPRDAAKKISQVLTDDGTAPLEYASFMLTPAQKELIREFARYNRVPQAQIVRSIIDDWCRMSGLVA